MKALNFSNFNAIFSIDKAKKWNPTFFRKGGSNTVRQSTTSDLGYQKDLSSLVRHDCPLLDETVTPWGCNS
jgi:hypothetical protein